MAPARSCLSTTDKQLAALVGIFERGFMYPKRSYSDRLKDPRWAEFRARCLYLATHVEDEDREMEIDLCCGFCWNQCTDSFHLHHKFYVAGREPWEYEPSDLVFLCGKCHSLLHEDALKVWTYMLSGNDLLNQRILQVIEMISTLDEVEQIRLWVGFREDIRHYKSCESKYPGDGPRTLSEIAEQYPLKPCCRYRLTQLTRERAA
jgi:hypothetical protein